MRSRLAEWSRRDLIEAARRMTPATRLEAHVEHSRQVAEIAAAGCRARGMRSSGSGQAPQLLLDVAPLLEAQGIRFAVIGAMAAAYYGAVRASLDAEGVVFPGDKSFEPLENALKTAGFQTEVRRGDSEAPIAVVIAVSDSHGNRVDLLSGIRGMDPAAADRTVPGNLPGGTLPIIAVEDFIAMKLFAGGPQDLADARRAFDVSRASVDGALLERVAAGFGRQVSERLRDLKNAPGS